MYPQRRYESAKPRLYVDVVSADGILREGLAAWFELHVDIADVVGKFASWADAVSSFDHLSDVVIIDVEPGDEVSLGGKVEAIIAAGSEVVVCSATSLPVLIRRSYLSGARAFVPRTLGAEVLRDAVLAAARGEQTIATELAAALDPTVHSIHLTSREHEAVVLYLGRGLSTAQVAESLGISANGAKKLLASARGKANQNREPLSRLAFRDTLINDGWLQPDQPTLPNLRDYCPQRTEASTAGDELMVV